MIQNKKLAENDLLWDDIADLILRCRKETRPMWQKYNVRTFS